MRLVSTKAVQTDSVAVKVALLDCLRHSGINALMFTGRCTFRIKGASPMPRGTSSSFAFRLRNTDWTAWRYVPRFQRMICGLKENDLEAWADCIRATDQCGTTCAI